MFPAKSYFLKVLTSFILFVSCLASYNEQYRVPYAVSDRWESYIFDDREYIVQNLPVVWENANILCRGHHNGTLAIIDTREKAEFLAEALSELQFPIESVWVGARRASADDPEGYRWGHGVELRRTSADVLHSELDAADDGRFPVWLNRTRIPVPEGGADCVALERVNHDKPVFLDLPCNLERPFVCEKDAQTQVRVREAGTVRCGGGAYRVFGGRLDWHQAAAFCVMNRMTLANIGSMKCLKKLGLTMLKARPSIEGAWVGARGSEGRWEWLDTARSIFESSDLTQGDYGVWPPMRDASNVKQSGCLQIDRHETKSPIFMEARCERRMQFICYKAFHSVLPARRTTIPPLSDDNYYYVLVRQMFTWQHAFDNCKAMNGTLAGLDSQEVMIELLLAMGENRDEPVEHIWVSGRLNVTRDTSDELTYTWYNPSTGKIIPGPKSADALYIPPWLSEEWSASNACLNLDREAHLTGLVYGMKCDTPQYSVCAIEKAVKAGPTEPTLTEEATQQL
ncbi:uncharacterized protein LOC123704105 [Colias croceus]|uniref:uncharacterized protein LOC123704105 n=1 Tax=Colias crocea TaxID=72248 RepID=UPI001E27BDF8|nr:uncharacterized protein LOC123704105 [Colias croceus]